MKQGRTILLLLTTIFLLTEIIFGYVVIVNGDGDILGATIKTLIFLLLILLFSKKFNLAKWILSISLILYGCLCLLVGFELTSIFYVIGFYNIFFGFYIHKSQALGVFRTKTYHTNRIANDGLAARRDDPIMINENLYPSLVKRYKALFIDSMLILFTLIIIMVVLQENEYRTITMVTAAAFILLTYEPFLTSYSKTVGQKLMKIKVGKLENPTQKISLLNAYLRWLTKGLLGWISFITIHFNRERRAIHDFASNSVVINDDFKDKVQTK
jgi:uncharacterized RDD family membrane protein YckC